MKQIIYSLKNIFSGLNSKLPKYSTSIKIFFSIILIFLVYKTKQDFFLLFTSFYELLFIWELTYFIYLKKKKIANFFNGFFVLFFNIQQISLIFGGTFVSLIMLSNIDSIEALKGKTLVYLSLIVPMIFLSILPVGDLSTTILNRKKFFHIIVITLSGLFIILNRMNSSIFNYYVLYQEKMEQLKMLNKIKTNSSSKIEFLKEIIEDGVRKPQTISENPNVIIIFTEGLSQSIIDDNRNFMPNLQKFQTESIVFDNYFNHTFATYAGLSGQLYSGYQYSNYDKNTLISIESILESRGYSTQFLNTEPNNPEFTQFLENFNYDSVIGEKNEGTLSDKEAYDLLFKHMVEMEKNNEPFFTTIYTFGTHVSLDSNDEKFDDGTNRMLNKFYNLDVQFGNFLEKFKNSDLYKNTILIFTSDHATYVDEDYLNTFGNNRLVGNLDKIPFYIYHKGIEPTRIDALGRNSLDLVPTLLDYLDIEESNYFLGESLFTDKFSDFDTLFFSEMNLLSTKDGKIQFLNDEDKAQLLSILEKYFSAKLTE
ncbi:TPA: LTA synthase family protein [Streptococcus suis]|nr:LTA synthase family protein [Streptococcus suis]